MPAITSIAGTTGILTLHGPAQGATKACLAGTSVTGPEQAGGIALRADTRCIDLKPGQTRGWKFTVVPGALADGRIAGAFRVNLTGADAADTMSISVPVGSSIARPVDESLRWALVAGFLTLSIVVPLLALWIANGWVGRFRLAGVRIASAPVVVTRTGIKPGRASGAALIEEDDVVAVGKGASRRRTFAAAGVRFAHTRALWPTRQPTAYASAGPGELIVSGTGRYTDAAGTRAPVLTALSRCWVLVVDAASVTGAQALGRIIFIVEPTGGLDEIIADRGEMVRGFAGWPDVWTKLQAVAGPGPVAQTPPSVPSLAPSLSSPPPEPSQTGIGEIPEPRSHRSSWVPLDDDGAPWRARRQASDALEREHPLVPEEPWPVAPPSSKQPGPKQPPGKRPSPPRSSLPNTPRL